MPDAATPQATPDAVHPAPGPVVRPATLRHSPQLCALPPNHLAAALMLEKALDGGPRPLDPVSHAGLVLVMDIPDGWLSPLLYNLHLLIRRHRVDGLPDDEAGDDDDREEALLDERDLRHRRAAQLGRLPAPRGAEPAGVAGFTPPLVETLDGARWTSEQRRRVARAWRAGQGVVLLLPPGAPTVPGELRMIAAPPRTVAPPNAALLAEVAVILAGCDATPGTTAWRRARRRLGVPDLADPLPLLGPEALFAAHRPGEDPACFLRRLAVLVARQGGGTRQAQPRLEDLSGTGEAGAWGLRLARDLRAYARGELPWSALDRGAVLAGPPGTGKTTLAQALARSAGVAFIATSLAEWQGSGEGHLGTTLGAMQASFAKARSAAPCILLIDELDGLGDRRTFHERHRDYSIQVVNGVLELLDGAAAREGVVVIGATNDASRLDPALLRPGRLDRVINVPLPDAQALVGILRHHLGADLPDDALPADALAGLATTAHGRRASGADVAGWVRGARARARHAGRPLAWDDLVAEVGPPAAALRPAELRRVCTHEAGHVLGYLLLDRSRQLVRRVRVPLGPIPAGGAQDLAITELDEDPARWRSTSLTPRRVRRQLRALLAGRAAEMVVLGEPSAGAGVTEGSDLAKATQVATLACASWGLGGTGGNLLWRPVAGNTIEVLAADPALRAEVDALLRTSMADAQRMVTRCREGINRIAGALARHGHLTGEDVRMVLRAPDHGPSKQQVARHPKDVRKARKAVQRGIVQDGGPSARSSCAKGSTP